jgi:SAM-dependent methyltransferase
MKHIISWIIINIPRKVLQRFSHFFLRIIQVFYLGKNIECPVCGREYRKMLPYGRNPARENALCPNCLSLERHRLIWLYLKEKTGFFKDNNKFLHIAPELCFIHRFESIPNLDYISADIESPLAKVKMDINKIPFEENTFDAAMCNHVLEHIEDDIKAMKEIYRVLKPFGWAILQVPFMGKNLKKTFEDPEVITPSERERVFGQRDHVRIYGQDYADRLRSAGFEVHEDRYVMELSEEEVKKYALAADEIIYFCIKPA